MTRSILAMLLTSALAAACATAPAPMPEPEAAAAPEEDPWVLVLEAERYGVIIDRARVGAIEGPPAMTMPDPTDLERATEATRRSAMRLYALRQLVCETGLVGPDDCGPLPPPDWLGEPVDAVADAAEIRRRIDWLTEVMGPFVDAGCDAGQSRQASEFPHYCSVE